MNIAIIGCGYVGLTTAAVLANCGYKVKAVEIDHKRLSVLKQGKSFFYEIGVDELIKEALDSKNLFFGDKVEDSIGDAEVIFSCVGTPDKDDGSSNLDFVYDVAEKVSRYAHDGSIFVQKSTVPVGTGQRIKALFNKAGKKIDYVSNPEFLREGTAISDSLWFDRAVAGGKSKKAVNKVLDIYKNVEAQRDRLGKIARITPLSANFTSQYFAVSRSSAELIKVTANTFLALKISFANNIALLSDAAGADVKSVMDAVGADKRIGRSFLNAGRGYGGGCFPKDVDGLIHSSAQHGVDIDIMRAAANINSSMPAYVVNKAEKVFGASFKGQPVAILGLSFKPSTSDTRRSPAIVIANLLAKHGALVSAYDPVANEEAKPDLDSSIVCVKSAQEAIKNAKCVFITTEWPEFIDTEAINLYKRSGVELIVDCMNSILAEVDGIAVCGVGRL